MPPPTGNGTHETILDSCRAPRAACERKLAELESHDRRAPFAATLRCVALLSVIGDTLEAAGHCPTALIDATIELARELPDDSAGCAAACRVAADALSELLDGGYERG